LSSRLIKVLVIVFCLVGVSSSNVFAKSMNDMAHKPMNDMLYNGLARNDVDMVKIAVDNGANVNYKRGSQSPLHIAIDLKNIDMVLYLCQKSALIDIGILGNGLNNKTELIHAASVDSLPLIQFFIGQGENVNATDKYKNTTLLTVLQSKESRVDVLEKVNYLISQKANVNKANKDGYTPLMATANNSGDSEANIAIAKALLTAGANADKKDNKKNTALQYAVNNNNKEMVQLLLTNYPN